MTVLVPDIRAYERFLHDTLFRLPGITHVRSSIVLKEVKAEMRLPLAISAPP
jgi:DNA-binding Lrp family transcriptional regulator